MNWGGYSMVKATLNSMDEIISQHKEYDHINLLSESDYPLKPAEEVHGFLDHYTGKSFMEMRLSDSDWWQEAQQKVQRYHWVDLSFRGKYFLERMVNTVTPKRSLPSDLLLTGRSQWMTLATTHIRFILEYSRKNPRVVRFFRQTWGPDEFFFQTILYNSAYRNDLINNNLRYIDWSEGKASPKTLLTTDFEALEGSGKLYARKFNPDVDDTILDLIDHRLLTNSRNP
ncbi:beta-1,6-N-acetylglucosaminyltransferase [Niabella sp. W65]|nr:beta-1,6-N-acetylglucosaminyltransferase [Niabella sp. W65]MCH7364315.1 beta-1,6-N-acetylglucosaminyltransferase [Niabella sp. W65]ULT40182.1 beta-1,6-N-acetylglucosaminyltransferase [Niabella sp. I65]